ncbi:metal ABC transporter solute-binding protein, Zn/Mn family [Rhizosaccharibacter radicis]|uniref:Zinc ABC transporter substrate-binding protein n=1 Tax=Rhizosaccharibacter radicis TaxID=2782605 RepID=A0ABT1VSX0_9PROT|nr:zinc ABC transporter substrate-binding protein [Acetobacteraceae bacterium KSS12]
MPRRAAVALAVLVLAALPARATSLVAAEAVYGDIARQIGGDGLAVRSVLNNADSDPHLFELTPGVARAVSAADIVVFNGIGYDPWMTALLRTGGGHEVLSVSALMARHAGDDPHLWFDPAAAPTLARALCDLLARRDPAGAGSYRTRRDAFLSSLQPLRARIAALRTRTAGVPVAATEPVFDPMMRALDMDVRDTPFALATMNDTEPSPAAVSALEEDLRHRRVRLFVFNSQAGSAAARRMVEIARQSGVPVLGVGETMPAGLDYQRWMISVLDATERALATP